MKRSDLARRLPEDDDSKRKAIEADMAAKLGLAVKERREQSGLNQTQLAALMNCSQAQVFRVESGRGVPHIGTLLRLAEALDARVILDITAQGIEIELRPIEAAPRRQRRAG